MSNDTTKPLTPFFTPEPIAIVGLGAVMPDANNINEFWQNIVTGKNSITEVPEDRWDPDLYWDDDRDAPDKTYSKIGAFIKSFSINPIDFRIPPNVLTQIDPVQQWALVSAKQALEDANYEDEDFPREKCAVIIGNSLGGEKSFEVAQRVYFPGLVRALRNSENFQKLSSDEQEELINDLEEKYKKNIPIINEDSMPGELANIVAGRIAAVFNLRGKNMTSDAACASSLAAMDVAFKGLRNYDFDAAVVGGADHSMDPPTYVKFSKIGALSADGSFPFDERANGFVMGEGAGMMVLKRLSDAKKAGDKIYGLITGVGSSSDGKGKGITAPNPIGQELAVKRALEAANIEPQDLQMIECHGTSTSVGDFVEVSTLEKVFKEAGVPPQSIRIGSIKSQIGHLKSAAGAAGLLKAALALHEKVYPPSINFSTPNPKIDWDSCPFVVNTHPIEWSVENGQPRRIGVSSFGFGGTNFHVIMEDYDENRDYPTAETYYSAISLGKEQQIGWQDYVNRNKDLEAEPLVVSASTHEKLTNILTKLPSELPASTVMSDEFAPSLLEIVRKYSFNPMDEFRAGISANSLDELKSFADLAKGAFEDFNKRKVAQARGVYVSEGMPAGRMGFVFPGQGSQYADMVVDLSNKYQIVQDTLDEADEILKDFLNKPLSEYIKLNGRDRKVVDEGLRQTEITQPAMLTADIAIFRLFKEFGIKPDAVAGHSLGEYAALVAAGVLSFEDALKAVAIRGKAMSEVDAEDKGTMASISGKLETVEDILDDVEGYVIAANKNSMSTTVISGSTEGVQNAIKAFEDKGINAIPLSVSAAFHTKIVEPAGKPLAEFLDKITFNPPTIPITSNVTGDFFPKDPEEIRDLMKQQVGAAVEWTKQVQSMFRDGITRFIEVGPKRALSSFVSDILVKEEVISIVSNHPKRGGIRSFNDAIAASAALGYPVNVTNSTSSILVPEYRWTQKIRPQKPQISTTAVKQKRSTPTSSDMSDQVQEFIDQTLGVLQSEAGKVRKLGINTDTIVVTGVGVGLPGKHKEVFAKDNIDRVLRGENFIDHVSTDQLDKQLNKNIRRLIKRSSGEAEFFHPTTYEDVIRLAGQAGSFDLVKEYGVNEDFAEAYDRATSLAIAAGLEAMKDAGIPLIREYRKTSTGSYLPGGWVLPPDLQDTTGVIFSSAFPGYDEFSQEMAKFNEYKYKQQSQKLLNDLYTEVSRRVEGESKDYLLNKLEKELAELGKTAQEYTFNRKLLLNILSMGHSQFAQLIRAKGPNTQINAACASTTQAMGLASDWIRNGRCDRVIIISADDVTSENLFEWIGSGFLASGAASIKDKVEEAALPFDRRRGGMIIGMGAAGLVVESEASANYRGVTPIVEILGTHYANSAYHGTRLDVNHVSHELQMLLDRVQIMYGITPEEIARSCMFMSHETYTPRRGGSAAAEIRSLVDNFGTSASKIYIANTKGFTGHAMGAGIEDAVAIKSLERGQIPPIANFKEPDPDLGDLRLSMGVKTNVDYAIRLAAGFGSQVAFVLYKRRGSGDRLTGAYDSWLTSIGTKKSDLYLEGKTLRVKDSGKPGIMSVPAKKLRPMMMSAKPRAGIAASTTSTKSVTTTSKPRSSVSNASKDAIIAKIQDVMTEMTGYPKEMLDPALDLESDLGVDTVKQVEILGRLNEDLGVEADESVSPADYPTINAVAEYYAGLTGGQAASSSSTASATPTHVTTPVSSSSSDMDKGEVISKIQTLLAEMTGYDASMLDPNYDLEADLGVDTVKMAESIGRLNEEFGVSTDETMNVADYPTINDVADYYIGRIQSGDVGTPQSASVSKPEVDTSQLDKIVKYISSQTGYPDVMLSDINIDLMNDLGVDGDTMSKIVEGLATEFNVDENKLRNAKTISDILSIISGGSAGASQPTTPSKTASTQTPEVTKKPTKKIEYSQASNIDPEQQSFVYKVISEKTGYPEMMLDNSLHIVKDLGMDDATKDEVMSAIAEKFDISKEELMKARTINEIFAVFEGQIIEIPEPVQEKPTTKKETSVTKPKSSTTLSGDRDTVQKDILEIIAEKTGYPLDMLDPNLDMEADLGIDTVKQAEIFGVAREKYGIPPIDGMLISEYNTINKITDLITSKSGEAILSGDTSVLTKPDTDHKQETSNRATHRYVLRYNEETLGDLSIEDYPLLSGALIAYKNGIISEVSEELGLVRYPSLKENIALRPKSTVVLVDPEEKNIGSVPQLFEFLKNNIENIDKLVLAVQAPKGYNGTIHEISPIQSAIGGMFKALSMEFNIKAKIFVYENKEQIIYEIFKPETEVAYFNDKRRILSLSEEDLDISDWKLPEDAVIVASGGAQGITFEMVKSITQPSNTVVLLGRTKIREDALEIANLSEKELNQRKFALMEELKAKGETVTPVILEKQWSKITKSASVFTNLKELEKVGCTVIYKSVDIQDTEAVNKAFEEVKNQLDDKVISHFIHGAGVEISKATKSKKVDEFNLVYNVKVSGFENILQELNEDKLQLVVGFSSVAGRFGNATQVDYSAANEYIAKRFAELSRDGINAKVIDWSAWAEIGMATRGSTQQVLESQGITMIPVNEGVQRFRDEIASGTDVEVVISGNLGGLSSKATWFEPDFFRGNMMDDYDGKDKRSSRILSLKRDRYLDDHRIDDKAVLPGVMGLETMAQVTRAIKGQRVSSMFDIGFNSPVKLPKDNDLEIITFADRVGAGIQTTLKSKFLGPDGKQLGDLRPHFDARMVVGNRVPGYPVLMKNQVKELRKFNILSKDVIYEVFFHGPSYQVIQKMNAYDENSVITTFSRPEKTMFVDDGDYDYEIDPLTIEAAFQTAGLHLALKEKIQGLPSSVKAIHLFDNENEPVLLKAYYLFGSETFSVYNVEIIDKNGNIIALLDNYEMVHTETKETPDIEATEDQELDKVRIIAGELDPQLTMVYVDCLVDVSEQFVQHFLTKSEQARYSGIQVKKKRLEWLAGRIAAKLAISAQELIGLDKIEIQKDDNRSPYAIVRGKKVDVSISHSNGLAAAIAGDTTVDLEIVEKRDKSFLKMAFSKEEIEIHELSKKNPEFITMLWTMKEAHLKRMRIGLKTDLHGVEIKLRNQSTAIVSSPQGTSKCVSTSNGQWVLTIALHNGKNQ